MKFRVDVILKARCKQPAMVLGYALQPDYFQLTDAARLDGIALRRTPIWPRARAVEGGIAVGLTLINPSDADKFTAGAVVELEP